MDLHFALDGLLQSVYNAPTGGILWGITLPLTLGLWWLVFQPGCAPSDRGLRWGSAIIGLLGGALGGVLISGLMIVVFEQGSLGKIGWDIVQSPAGYPTFSSRLSAVAPSRLPLVFPIMGGLMGLGIGLLAAQLRCEERRKPDAQEGEPEPLFTLFWRLMRRSWLAALGFYALCALTTPILMPFVVRKALPEQYNQKAGAAAERLQEYSSRTLLWKFLGESLILSTGGWGLSLAITAAYLVRKVEFAMEEMDE
jgi:hypothetical protein